jgi:hypothetical protein
MLLEGLVSDPPDSCVTEGHAAVIDRNGDLVWRNDGLPGIPVYSPTGDSIIAHMGDEVDVGLYICRPSDGTVVWSAKPDGIGWLQDASYSADGAHILVRTDADQHDGQRRDAAVSMYNPSGDLLWRLSFPGGVTAAGTSADGSTTAALVDDGSESSSAKVVREI